LKPLLREAERYGPPKMSTAAWYVDLTGRSPTNYGGTNFIVVDLDQTVVRCPTVKLDDEKFIVVRIMQPPLGTVTEPLCIIIHPVHA
jgi:hypothetical protein